MGEESLALADAKRRGTEDGYREGKKQDFAARGLMCFGLSCAGDYISEVYARNYLNAFQEALEDLRSQGVTVNDPRDEGKIPLYQIGGGGNFLTKDEVLDMLHESQMDKVRIGVVRKWLGSLPGVATTCNVKTPYGELRRVK